MLLFSCKEKEKEENKSMSENIETKIDLKEMESNFMKWWTYYNNNISLSSNFIGLNEQSDTIGKKQFLEKLTSGKFIPIQLKSKNNIQIYALHKLDSLADKSIGSTIKDESLTSLSYFNMEGLAFPEFKFTDLNGNVYTNENTKGKTIIIKTWFINCVACVAEFPELNELVEKYKNNKKIIFISLALDEKNKLVDFLKRKDFKYEIIANQDEFITKKLNLHSYPTHIVVNKNGVITKVVNKASEMITFFENENTN